MKEDVLLSDFVEDVIRFDLVGSNIKPVFQLDKKLWSARIDRGQIEQVFSNLVINAKEAMPDAGHLYVTLENIETSGRLVPELSNGKYIKITMRDEGEGIPKEYIDRVFDPYFTTKEAGSGLGLATVFSVIHKHNGYIDINSAIDHGTTFTFYLPASDEQQLQKYTQTRTENLLSKRALSILVMDDEKPIREIISELLEKAGFSVETVEDGQQAIDRYSEKMAAGKPFDAVIMDLTIPGGMGGKEAVKSILAIDPRANVVVSSGYADDPIVANYTDYGFKGTAIKPYSINTLRETLVSVLQSK